MPKCSTNVWVPASSQASRKIIEESSYATTPAQSTGEPTPPCGQRVNKIAFSKQEIKEIDTMLQKETTLASQSSENDGESSSTVKIKQYGNFAYSLHDHVQCETAADIHAKRDTQSLSGSTKRVTPE